MAETASQVRSGQALEPAAAHEYYGEWAAHPHALLSVVVIGASGDLAAKRTFPALAELFEGGFLPHKFQVIGLARSDMSQDQFKHKISRKMTHQGGEGDQPFLQHVRYVRAQSYDAGDSSTWQALSKELCDWEEANAADKGSPKGRLFYLALPPNVYLGVCQGLKRHCCPPSESHSDWCRVVIEKPFGRDLASARLLGQELHALFAEPQIYRMDHFLGKEMSQNMLILRFANPIVSAFWNNKYVSSVQVVCKEAHGTAGRGGYFDNYGVIRDVIQNHLIQVLALVTMEAPVSLTPDDVRREKTKLLRCIPPIKMEDTVIGQFTPGMMGGRPGYLDDPTVPPNSKTATYAACKMFINNERWSGVPFVMKAGKGLDENEVAVRMQLKPAGAPFLTGLGEMRDEFVIRVQPEEAIYAKIVVKAPGLDVRADMSELDLSYTERYKGVNIPPAYQRLILDVIRGDATHFVDQQELEAAWAIFTPVLQDIDAGRVPLHTYPAGTRGPGAADDLMRAAGYVPSKTYVWRRAAGVHPPHPKPGEGKAHAMHKERQAEHAAHEPRHAAYREEGEAEGKKYGAGMNLAQAAPVGGHPHARPHTVDDALAQLEGHK